MKFSSVLMAVVALCCSLSSGLSAQEPQIVPQINPVSRQVDSPFAGLESRGYDSSAAYGPGDRGGRQCRDEWCGCRDIFLSCRSGCGSFVLRCDGTGAAIYSLQGRPRAVKLVKAARQCQRDFVIYEEADSNCGICWMFSKDCVGYQHDIYIQHRDNPLACDWRFFCNGDKCRPSSPCYPPAGCQSGGCYR